MNIIKRRIVLGTPGTGKTRLVKQKVVEDFREDNVYIIGEYTDEYRRFFEKMPKGYITYNYMDLKDIPEIIVGDIDLFSIHNLENKENLEQTIKENIIYIAEYFRDEFSLLPHQVLDIQSALSEMYQAEWETIKSNTETYKPVDGYEMFLGYILKKNQQVYQRLSDVKRKYSDEAKKLINAFNGQKTFGFTKENIDIIQPHWRTGQESNNLILLELKKKLSMKKKNVIIIDDYPELGMDLYHYPFSNQYDVELLYIGGGGVPFDRIERDTDVIVFGYRTKNQSLFDKLPKEWGLDLEYIKNFMYYLKPGKVLNLKDLIRVKNEDVHLHIKDSI